MSGTWEDFRSLPVEYQDLLRLAEEKFEISIKPLQLLVGGFSGAAVFLVSVTYHKDSHVEHLILKLDHKSSHSKNDEWTRHKILMRNASKEFLDQNLPDLAFDRIETDNAIAIFYSVAGQSLLNFLPLSKFTHQAQFETIFNETNKVLLTKWNENPEISQAVHPRTVIERWLGFRLDAGRNIEAFIRLNTHRDPEIPGLLIYGDVFPNPLFYARSAEPWGSCRPIDIATGQIHGDLNTNNILVNFSDGRLDGYYLIDFALFKEDMPLFYDQRYLEMSYLLRSLSPSNFSTIVELVKLIADGDHFDHQSVPIEMMGVSSVINSARSAFGAWVDEIYPSLHDDLWGQYWLAGLAAGLGYTHKAGLPDEQRMVGLIYAAANLKRFITKFNLPTPGEVVLLYAANAFGEPGSIQTPPRSHDHLPSPKTHFVGRNKQLSEIRALLQESEIQLLTLIGAGGTGKTRLSLEVARDVLDQFPDGVYFVPLADDTEENQLVSRIAKKLNVREGGRPLLESLRDYLYDKQLLLILDNFEQLVSYSPVIGELLEHAPNLKIITTSRIPLNLQREHIFPVPPLQLPEKDPVLTLTELEDNESIKLFVKRTQAILPDFELTESNANAVAEICRRLDGLPLAIELAAARIKLLSPQAILDRLDKKLKLLTGGARDLPYRHQALRNTIEWSYQLLNQEERVLINRLSVFSGGFNMDAVEAICNKDGEFDILDGLGALVDNSLILQAKSFDGQPRFTMLETIREFASEKLLESEENLKFKALHARYFGDIVVNQIAFQIYSKKAVYWMDWAERELDNIRTTLTWSLSSQGDINLGALMVMSLIWFWYRRGYLREGVNWSERMLEEPSLQEVSISRAFALVSGGLLAIWTGEQEKGLTQIEESFALMKREEEDRWIALAMMSNGVALLNMGKDHQARPLFEQAQKIFKESGQDYFNAITLVHLGNVELGLGNPEKALAILEEARLLARKLDENWILSFVINNLGEVARVQGQYDLARRYYQDCQNLLSETGDNGDMARFVHSLGYIAQHEGDTVKAESLFRESLVMFRRLGNRRGIAECIAGLAGLTAGQGDCKRGAVMLGAAEGLLQSTGGAWWPADRVEVEKNLGIIKSSLDKDLFNKLWQAGGEMNIDQAINYTNETQ